MRAKLVARFVALAAVSSALVPAGNAAAAGHRPHHRPEVTLSFSAPTYTTTDVPVLTYGWKHRDPDVRLELQTKIDGTWTRAKRLRDVTGHHGTGTLTLPALPLGSYKYRVIAFRRGYGVARVFASTQVYGGVPITNLIAVTHDSNAEIKSGVVPIGGQPFSYTFDRYLTGASIWRSVVDIPSTSCRAIGIPLASRRRDSSTGGTFSMRAISTGDVVITANAAAPDVGAGLLSNVPVGARLAVQVMSDRDVDYFGAGQALCYTADGRA